MEENAGIIRLTAKHDILPFDCGDSDLNGKRCKGLSRKVIGCHLSC